MYILKEDEVVATKQTHSMMRKSRIVVFLEKTKTKDSPKRTLKDHITVTTVITRL